MSSRRWGEAGAASSKAPQAAVAINSPQPPRILVVDIHPPHWAHTCPKLCEALENVFSLACSLAGPPRIPLFSLYVTQSQQECLLPFLPVRGGFARLQSCIAELQALPTEGMFRQPKENTVAQAVQDGLQQFKQYTGCGMAGASLSNNATEITVLTSQCGPDVARQLETGLQNVDLVHLRQLQVVEISKARFQEPPEAGGGAGQPLSISSSSSESGTVLGTDIALQTVENDTVALEMLFKAWFQDHSSDQEHLHLLLPSPGTLSCPATPGGNLACVKCDFQERILHPWLLLLGGRHGSAEEASRGAVQGGFWAAPTQLLAPRKLRVLRALKATGLCSSLLFGPSVIVLPTSCWQLNWDELEANQQHFQALCRCLWARGWLLLAKYEETLGGPGPGWNPLDSSLQVLLPSESGSLLLRSVVARELLLPCSFPAAPAAPLEAETHRMESILDGLEVEAAYNPLGMASHLYRGLRRGLARPPASRPPRPTERHLPRQQGIRGHGSKARATVAPLRMVISPTHTPSESVLSLFSSPEDEFQETSK
ncbi:meiosis 1 arrest protein [Pogona vitticeps]